MHIRNPLKMTDWPIKRFLTTIVTIQLTLWCLIALEVIGLEATVLRQIIGLIYLSFLPGIIILRILRLHQLGSIETTLYSVGLSLFVVMFGGVIINIVSPFAGISRPISTMPLMISFTALISVLCVVAWARDRKFSAPAFADFKALLTPPMLFLLLILSCITTNARKGCFHAVAVAVLNRKGSSNVSCFFSWKLNLGSFHQGLPFQENQFQTGNQANFQKPS